MTQQNTLENQFHEEMLSLYYRAKEDCGYRASRYLQMVRRRGGIDAARVLLKRKITGEDIASGLTRVGLCGRLDLSVEYLILQPRWHDLFTEEERATARDRLARLGWKGSW